MTQKAKQRCHKGKEKRKGGVATSFADGFVVLPVLLLISSQQALNLTMPLFLVSRKIIKQSKSSL